MKTMNFLDDFIKDEKLSAITFSSFLSFSSFSPQRMG
jgi:hypothetical protein